MLNYRYWRFYGASAFLLFGKTLNRLPEKVLVQVWDQDLLKSNLSGPNGVETQALSILRKFCPHIAHLPLHYFFHSDIDNYHPRLYGRMEYNAEFRDWVKAHYETLEWFLEEGAHADRVQDPTLETPHPVSPCYSSKPQPGDIPSWEMLHYLLRERQVMGYAPFPLSGCKHPSRMEYWIKQRKIPDPCWSSKHRNWILPPIPVKNENYNCSRYASDPTGEKNYSEWLDKYAIEYLQSICPRNMTEEQMREHYMKSRGVVC